MTTNLTDPHAPVTDEELDQMIWKLERDGGMTPKLLSLMRELREVRKVASGLRRAIGIVPLTGDEMSLLLNAEKLNQPVRETNDSGWIPVSERMPEHKTGVIVAFEMDGPGDWRMKWASYIPEHPDSINGWLIPGASWTPTHWQPLPEPPKEVKGE